MPGPQVSVVVPTKDRPSLLERALASALEQRGPEIEIIVADDGDGAGEAAARAARDHRVSAFRTGRRGQVAARNMAVARARGRLIAFLDDDDWWSAPDHLAGLADAIGSSAGLSYANGRIVQEYDGGTVLPFAASFDRTAIRRDNLLLVSGIAYLRALHDRIGAFDETLPVYWDWDFYLRLADAGVVFTPSGGDGVCISVRATTVSASSQTAARQADLDRLCAKHGLTGIVLRNHDSIAGDQARAGRSG